jgi:RsiW-degrading membrane proteinase PrsW (M82 family)
MCLWAVVGFCLLGIFINTFSFLFQDTFDEDNSFVLLPAVLFGLMLCSFVFVQSPQRIIVLVSPISIPQRSPPYNA